MLYQYVRPVKIVLTILIAYGMKNIDKKPKWKDLLAVIMVALGIGLLNTIV